VKYGFLARHRAVWPIRTMCRMLGVSHGGFYDWCGRRPSRRSQDNDRLTGRIRASFLLSDRTYGAPRVWRDLIDLGEACSENRVARLMRAAHLQARAVSSPAL
jgi:putative transposase